MSSRFAVAAFVLAAGCASADQAPALPQEVSFTGADYSYSGPDTIAPGMTNLRFTNQGQQEHHLVLARLDQGHSLQDLLDYIATTPSSSPAWATYVGAANEVSNGSSTGSILDLAEGNYAILCLVADPSDGVPHIMKGMSRELVVAGGRHEAPAPVATEEIRMSDLTYEIPALTAGTHVFHMVNDGPQLHEAQLVRLNDGASEADFVAALKLGASTPPPGTMVGGGGPLSPGMENWYTVTLEPGKYLLICFVPDVNGFTPHFMEGMVREFTVAG